MKQFCNTLSLLLALFATQQINAQCTGTKGPNILGAKGSFSAPFVTINPSAAACAASGTSTFSPVGNVGKALSGCSSTGDILPCSPYPYTAASGGLNPEPSYSVVKVIGDANGFNCLKGQWKGSDHTGDGGYFMVVNGAHNSSVDQRFYQVKNIPVCIGSTYEVSAWAINVLPSTYSSIPANARPDISLKINGVEVARSGPIDYKAIPAWIKISGTFTATTSSVEFHAVNNTVFATSNDFGFDDVSINVCESQIAVEGPANICSGNNVSPTFTVSDPAQLNSWYKLQLSTNAGTTYSDLTAPEQATFNGNTYSVNYNLGAANMLMNGYKYRFVTAASQEALGSPNCGSYNDYTIIVNDCGPLPVKLSAFNGRYANGTAYLDWQTSQEINTARFELLRSFDGMRFNSIATIRSAGNSNSVRGYNYRDNTAGTGKYVYYRLKQIDLDGKSTLSNIIRLALGENTGMDIFPNPFSSQFTVSFSSPVAANATLMLRNSTGQIVYQRNLQTTKGNNSFALNQLPALPQGTYYVQVYNDRFNYTGKLQKK